MLLNRFRGAALIAAVMSPGCLEPTEEGDDANGSAESELAASGVVHRFQNRTTGKCLTFRDSAPGNITMEGCTEANRARQRWRIEVGYDPVYGLYYNTLMSTFRWGECVDHNVNVGLVTLSAGGTCLYYGQRAFEVTAGTVNGLKIWSRNGSLRCVDSLERMVNCGEWSTSWEALPR